MKVLALRGKSSSGKTHTLKRFILKIDHMKDHSLIEVGYIKGDKCNLMAITHEELSDILESNDDVYAIYDVNGTIVCVTTQGDAKKYMDQTLKNLKQKLISKNGTSIKDFDIYICSVRKGRNESETAQFVKGVSDDNVEYIEKTEIGKDIYNYKTINKSDVKRLLEKYLEIF